MDSQNGKRGKTQAHVGWLVGLSVALLILFAVAILITILVYEQRLGDAERKQCAILRTVRLAEELERLLYDRVAISTRGAVARAAETMRADEYAALLAAQAAALPAVLARYVDERSAQEAAQTAEAMARVAAQLVEVTLARRRGAVSAAAAVANSDLFPSQAASGANAEEGADPAQLQRQYETLAARLAGLIGQGLRRGSKFDAQALTRQQLDYLRLLVQFADAAASARWQEAEQAAGRLMDNAARTADTLAEAVARRNLSMAQRQLVITEVSPNF